MRKLVVAGSMLAMVAVLAVVFWPDPQPAQPTTSSSAVPAPRLDPAVAPVTAVTSIESERESHAATDDVRRSVAPTTAPASLGSECLLRGRCVDGAGRPMADVIVRLKGTPGHSERLAAWGRDHDEPDPYDETITTDSDGGFEFRFWPPPPFQFYLELSKPGFVGLSGTWSVLEPGTTTDLGDLVMLQGTLLRGRVVDTAGTPVAKADVVWTGQSSGRGRVSPSLRLPCRVSGPNGTFEGSSLLPPSTYLPVVHRRKIRSPKELVLDGSQSEQFVEIVVEVFDDQEAVTGIVVDEAGQPAGGVAVHPDPLKHYDQMNIITGADGRFFVPKPEQDGGEGVHLSFQSSRHESRRPDELFAWGSSDVRVVLQSQPSLEVLVVRDADGAPVEDYQLRVLWPGTSTPASYSDVAVRGGMHHVGGTLTIPSVSRGKHLLVVEPRDSALSVGLLDIDVPTSSLVTVRLPVSVQRELRVQFDDGSPVARSPVQLADASAIAMLERSLPGFVRKPNVRIGIEPTSEWATRSHSSAKEIQVGTTDAAGRCILRGPAGRDLVLRLPGPPHSPLDLFDVRLDVAEPLVITVLRGGTLTGTLYPLEVLEELRRIAGSDEPGAGSDDEGRMPHVRLVRAGNAATETLPVDPRRAHVAKDGTFTISGVPPGTWAVELAWFVANDNGESWASESCGSVALHDGTVTHFDLDGSFLFPGELEGTALENGAPLANTALKVIGRHAKNSLGVEPETFHSVTTDSRGQFRLRIRAGEYRVLRHVQDGDLWWSLPAKHRVPVVARRLVSGTFAFESGVARLRVVDALGAPVAGVAIALHDASTGDHRSLAPSGPDGRIEAIVEQKLYGATVLPKRLTSPDDLRRYLASRASVADPLSSVRIRLGDVQVPAGQTKEILLQLPVDW
ncbi:MAG: carboxypeptidase-like regulatory domain-containing protein [Planctomycetota bacterium]